jgi:hypothetical protein
VKSAFIVVTAATVIACVTGCAAARPYVAAPAPTVGIAADRPPSPATWPKYPHFAARRSCWAPPLDTDAILDRVAPSYAPPARAHPIAPAAVARRLLAGFGDRRFVRAITFSPAPRRYAHARPPAGALQAQIVLRGGKYVRDPSPERALTEAIAHYEGAIVGDALRDDFCDAGGAPLLMTSLAGGGGSRVNSASAIGQRFPNPSPTAFRKRVALIGRRFGFRVVSLRLLRPRQMAPLLIVRTNRPRKAFIGDVARIMELLDPATNAHGHATTFEAFFFAAEDAKGPFVSTDFETRGSSSHSESVAPGCPYPYGVNGFSPRLGRCS